MNKPINIKTLQHIATGNNERPLTVTPASSTFMQRLEGLLSKEITLFSRPFPDKVKESFYLELASLMGAGLDIRTALQLIRDEQEKKKIQDILTSVLEKIISGSSLSVSLRQHPPFTPYEYYTIEIGEETGKLNAVLKQLAIYYKARIKQRRQIVGALTYPVIVISVASCSVLFMMNFVVPMFADVFKRFGGELPFITRYVLHFSNFMQAVAGKLSLAVLAAGGILFFNRHKPAYKKYRDLFIQRAPVVKNIVSRIYMARFASTMQLLLGARVPLVQALALSKQILGFYPLEQAVSHIEKDILKGMPLHESMAAHKVFPTKMVALVKVGEEVNELEMFFKTLAERYSEELDFQTTQLSKFIEPVIIIVLGLVVGLVLIAMYLPMFNMGNTMH